MSAHRYVFNHSMLRVKDPDVSLDFYERVMGMKLMHRLDIEQGQFTLFFLVDGQLAEEAPAEGPERARWLFAQRGVLELTHNWGTENDPEFSYHDGNAQPQGFGHICLSVPDLERAVAAFDEEGVSFVKRPEEGMMRDIAFIRDPDGYWIEILQADRMTAF
jgi:lactoylglutathione lyase